jgi:putative ABC transport system substrate-binding protein
MNKQQIIYGSIITNVLLLFFIGYYKLYVSRQCNHNDHEKPTYNVALFLPASHAALDEISDGFTRTLQQNVDGNINFTVFNANGNKTLLRAQSEEIINGSYDLVFTIGTACTQTMKELTTKKQIALPIVFGAVGDPVGTHIVASLESSGNHITGVYEGRNYKQQLQFLKELKPNAQSVLLVFDPSSIQHFEEDKEEIVRECATLGLQFQALQVYNPNEISQKVPALIDSADTLLILKDHTTVGALDNLIKLCNQAGVTLYASDLNSGDKGAALAYGIHEADTGITAAHAAQQVLLQRAPTDIPIKPVEPMKIKLNTRVMQQQGLNVPSVQIDLMAVGEVLR